MKFRITLLVGFLALILGFTAFKADDDLFNQLLKKLDDYTSKYPQEKVYLQLDKPHYTAGDRIWFKAYLVNTKTKIPSKLSKILYVELIDEKDSLKRQLKLPLVSGLSWSDIKLPDTLQEGNYRIRAYTSYMRNYGTDFFFDKTIKVGNGWKNKVIATTNYQYKKENNADQVKATVHFEDKNGIAYRESDVNYEVKLDYKTILKGKTKTDPNGDAEINFVNNQSSTKTGRILATLNLPNNKKVLKSIPITSTSNDVDVQFLPEGGVLIEDLPQKIAIKAVNSAGKGEDVSGKITDEAGNLITTFNTSYLGMGSFITNVQPGKTYKATIKFNDGSEKDFRLPLAQPKGYALSIDNTDETNVKVKLMASQGMTIGEELKIVAQQGGNIYHVSKAKVNQQLLSASVAKNKLPSGIIQFTLFSKDNEPIAERLIFNKNTQDQIDLNLETSSVSTQKEGKSTFTLNAAQGQKPITGSFSVSVINKTKVASEEDIESNILTTLLLTSDLTGYVEKPNHYFLNDDAKTNQELDNLMLTQGWRRFLWKGVINNISPNITFLPEQSTSISGVVTKGGKPVSRGKVMLMAKETGGFVIDTLTNQDGSFKFDNLLFKDSTKFVVQARTSTGEKKVDISIDKIADQSVTKNKNLADVEVNVSNKLMGYIKANDAYFDEMKRLGLLENSIKLKEITVEGKKGASPNSSNLNGPGNADFVLTADKIETCYSLQQCIDSKIPGIIKGQSGRNGAGSVNNSTFMLIILDGLQDADVNLIDPRNVESIEFLKTYALTAIYGTRASGGVLIITTKTGAKLSYKYEAEGIVSLNPKGLSVSKVFYSPQYDKPSSNAIGDSRSTIYWEPQVVTDENGKAKFEFYNADEAGNYRVVIEGIDIEGHLARKVYTYDVK
jgi:TonB-dependent SusC/RagA subfamily outer membrane receptor